MIDIPWFEAGLPVPAEILARFKTWPDTDALNLYARQGYAILDLFTEAEHHKLGDRLVDEILKLAADPETIKLDAQYHYNNSPRIFEAWKKIPEVAALACHHKIITFLTNAYGRQARPFQTINFIKGSNQPLHQDSLHFYTDPPRWMAGAWIALQNMTEKNGTLQVVPGTHRWPFIHYNQVTGIRMAMSNEEKYECYEYYLQEMLNLNQLTPMPVYLKKGQVIIWAANLLHGGAPILDPDASRHSMAVHYYFEGCQKYYSPMHSIPGLTYAEKNLEEKNIFAKAQEAEALGIKF